MANPYHTLAVGIAYAILIFFGLGTCGDYARFMLKTAGVVDVKESVWIGTTTSILTVIFGWSIWMVSGSGCGS